MNMCPPQHRYTSKCSCSRWRRAAVGISIGKTRTAHKARLQESFLATGAYGIRDRRRWNDERNDEQPRTQHPERICLVRSDGGTAVAIGYGPTAAGGPGGASANSPRRQPNSGEGPMRVPPRAWLGVEAGASLDRNSCGYRVGTICSGEQPEIQTQWDECREGARRCGSGSALRMPPSAWAGGFLNISGEASICMLRKSLTIALSQAQKTGFCQRCRWLESRQRFANLIEQHHATAEENQGRAG